ncbi:MULTISPECIES: sodium ion-translocating decarboxylase subunit beta [Desulfococcus]|uniref:Sodium ion-translocating decarboxylase, beta subunit n=1 Tax=Desulfococcus multivorans DSM 2059 TaxID=1121405 RepID=S7TCR7_DESML|nr:sodium ion-translocating decarboxylase subunit beta [Desulfococcus multivorans]AOY57124.1 OadB1: oxaloacetate decarboxylase, subunit beta [Desulfococcus multivorans]AQU99623.1 glutaconyl-CoA decarboxylase subunit beta [Desulfococcus multivorans]EPR34456.1 sodium ion-translocating decarboxylase, beta subunit [Desulfococcus multivorans DSM 2059]SJZ87106.1 oxaloacetate decarboxylase, beta subunit [Desulfococcus multivorans DSM 2059]
MSWDQVLELIVSILTTQTGLPNLMFKQVIMLAVAFFFLYLAVAKNYEPLLLVPIGFGIFLVNFPLVPLMGFTEHGTPELIRAFYKYGVEWEIIPCVIFLGLGAMTDFGPLIANPKTLIIGAGAQLGVFVTYIGVLFFGFTLKEAASVGIIGGADGPTTIYLTAKLAPHLLGANALAAYSYMAMVPLIQPPIMRLFTTPEQRKIRMRQLRPVSTREKILFPLIASALIILLVPAVAPLMGMFMFGNFMRECGVVKRLTDTAQNALMNIVTIFLGVSVGATMEAEKFLSLKPLLIFGFGLVDFTICTVGGILTVHIMNLFLKEKMNPLIGSAGVSAVPMSARVTHSEGMKADPDNWLIMHAMGPNLAGVIGSAAAAGMFIAMFN